MPTTHDTPLLTVFRNGQAKLSDKARRALLGKTAVVLSAPSTIGGRWLLLPVDWIGEGALTLYDDRGQKRFGAHSLATSVFAMLPAAQKNVRLLLAPAPLGFWLLPSGEVPHKSATTGQEA
jgi:DNA-binding transcriptional regulator PaaX